jgi:ribulose-5-phosphate 4-epimerase/fuculose-1-phosphate aldolase
MATKARKRMDRIVRHLTDAAPSDAPPDITRQRLRRELASSQRERVKSEYGYDLPGDESPIYQLKEYLGSGEEVEDVIEEELPPRLPELAEPADTTSAVEQARYALSKACHVAFQLGVGGEALEDAASCQVPGGGGLLLVKPLGVRFSEVTPKQLVLVSLKDLPKMHADLHRASSKSGFVLSARSEGCEMVSVTRDGLLPLCQDALRVFGNVQRVDEENLELRAARPKHRDVSCWLVKNHGAVCSGRTAEEAVANLVWVTRACTFQTRTMASVGGDVSRLDLMNYSDAIKAKAELFTRFSNESVATHLFQLLM